MVPNGMLSPFWGARVGRRETRKRRLRRRVAGLEVPHIVTEVSRNETPLTLTRKNLLKEVMMTKRLRLSVFALTVSLLSLVGVASVQPAEADLRCTQLALCEGGGGCLDGGDPVNCVITCTGGGTVTCEVKQN